MEQNSSDDEVNTSKRKRKTSNQVNEASTSNYEINASSDETNLFFGKASTSYDEGNTCDFQWKNIGSKKKLIISELLYYQNILEFEILRSNETIKRLKKDRSRKCGIITQQQEMISKLEDELKRIYESQGDIARYSQLTNGKSNRTVLIISNVRHYAEQGQTLLGSISETAYPSCRKCSALASCASNLILYPCAELHGTQAGVSNLEQVTPSPSSSDTDNSRISGSLKMKISSFSENNATSQSKIGEKLRNRTSAFHNIRSSSSECLLGSSAAESTNDMPKTSFRAKDLKRCYKATEALQNSKHYRASVASVVAKVAAESNKNPKNPRGFISTPIAQVSTKARKNSKYSRLSTSITKVPQVYQEESQVKDSCSNPSNSKHSAAPSVAAHISKRIGKKSEIKESKSKRKRKESDKTAKKTKTMKMLNSRGHSSETTTSVPKSRNRLTKGASSASYTIYDVENDPQMNPVVVLTDFLLNKEEEKNPYVYKFKKRFYELGDKSNRAESNQEANEYMKANINFKPKENVKQGPNDVLNDDDSNISESGEEECMEEMSSPLSVVSPIEKHLTNNTVDKNSLSPLPSSPDYNAEDVEGLEDSSNDTSSKDLKSSSSCEELPLKNQGKGPHTPPGSGPNSPIRGPHTPPGIRPPSPEGHPENEECHYE